MKKYFRLPDNSIFQKRPGGAVLSLKTEAENWGKEYRMEVNVDGARLLELCDGKSTLDDILETNNSRYPAALLSKETGAEFFADALEAGMVEVSGEPAACTSRVCGSHEHYYPENTTVELTTQCNYSCKHCYRESSPSENTHINYDKLMKFLHDFRDHGGSILALTGGEAMLYKNFFELVEWACGNFPSVAVLTNAYYLQDKAVERLLPFRDKLIFCVSLDSHRPEFHNAFRGKADAFEKTLRAIELLGRHKFRFRVSMSVIKDNFFDIDATAELARRNGALYFAYSPVLSTGRGDALDGGLAADYGKDPRYAEYEKMLREKYKGFLRGVYNRPGDQLDRPADRPNCGILHSTLAMGPDGEIRPCALFAGGLKVGNAFNQPFEEIFHSPLGAAFSSMPAPSKETCGDCTKFGLCRGCIFLGLKNGLNDPGCKWVKTSDIRKYLTGELEGRKCADMEL